MLSTMASTTVVVKQPRNVSIGDWSSGLFHCTDDMKDCCFGCWCCPCHACSVTREFGECLCLPLLDMCGIIPPVVMGMRFALRQRHGIEGTMCRDCLAATFCSPCVWCQISRELSNRTMPSSLADLIR